MEYIKSICATLGIPLDIRTFYSDEYEDVCVLYYIDGVEYNEENIEGFLAYLSGYLKALVMLDHLKPL
jgi:hypothetical protein